jgi:undecaprenyl-diphosphatase
LGYRFINKQFHIFAKYELITLGFNLFGLYLFFKTVQDAITDKVFLLELDVFVNNFFFIHSQEWIRDFMLIFTNIFSPTLITGVSVVLIAYLIHKKNYYYSLISIFSLGGGYVFTFIIKNIVTRIRPENAFISVSGYSFPSGHAVAATIFFTLLIYFFIVKIKSMIIREILVVICVISMLLTAFSRVYLGVHWLSDVLAGIGFGLFWVTSIILLVKYVNIIVSLFKKAEDTNNF